MPAESFDKPPGHHNRFGVRDIQNDPPVFSPGDIAHPDTGNLADTQQSAVGNMQKGKIPHILQT